MARRAFEGVLIHGAQGVRSLGVLPLARRAHQGLLSLKMKHPIACRQMPAHPPGKQVTKG